MKEHETLLNGTKYSESFKAFQCGTCIRLSTREMLTMRNGYPDEMGFYVCEFCGVPMLQDKTLAHEKYK